MAYSATVEHTDELISKVIDKLKQITEVTHHAGDMNIDHRVVNEALVARLQTRILPSEKGSVVPHAAQPFELGLLKKT